MAALEIDEAVEDAALEPLSGQFCEEAFGGRRVVSPGAYIGANHNSPLPAPR